MMISPPHRTNASGGQTADEDHRPGERPTLSVVIPVFNEVEALPHLMERLRPVLNDLGLPWEIVFCDDGSSDGSADLLDAEAEADPRVKVLHFRRNFGQTAALDAGFKHSRGEFVVAMDADLQNDPADIPMMIAMAREGYDVVKGWRKDRQDPLISRKIPSRVANRIISWVTELRLHDYGCTLTLFRSEILREIHLYGEMHRFIPVYAVAVGARIIEVPVRHHARAYGRSKYTISRTFRVLLDLITVRFLLGYHTNPLYFFGKFAFGAMFAGMASWGWTLTKKIVWGEPLFTDPFFFFGSFLLLAGLLVLLVGLLAEVTMRTYYESQGRTAWVLRSTRNLPPGGSAAHDQPPRSQGQK